MRQLALEDYFADDGAVVYYDEETNRIGIEPGDDTGADEAAYTVSKTGAAGPIAAQVFRQQAGRLPDVTTQYVPAWDDKMRPYRRF